MNKDVIYIDVEDDITAIIGKVKDTKEKVVALVPPKRIGVLQSAVNLRLLARAAGQHDKHLVLISSNSALMALASAAKIPIAKNLQSKPELPEIAALDIDNGEDIIDGASLPVGELARTAEPKSLASAALADPTLDDGIRTSPVDDTPRAAPPAPGQLPKKPKPKSGIKVPNFNTFRKKLLLIGGALALLLIFLIWAIFFAPHATVIITARTTDSSANAKVALGANQSTNAAESTLKTAVEQIKKDASLEFDATGTKEVGEKARGTVQLGRTSVSSNPISVPAGTSFSYGPHIFISTENATLNGTTVGPGGIIQDSATVGVVASQIGDDYNLSAREYQSSVSGISANGSDMGGGSKRQIKVVSSGDVQKATDQLAQQNSDDIKKQLIGKFNNSFIVIDQTFKTDRATPQVTPGVDQEVSGAGKARVTTSITYSVSAVARADTDNFLDDYFNERLDSKSEQRVYDNGVKKVTFTNLAPADDGFTANIVATAKVGPRVDDNAIKNTTKGKRYGEIQSSLESIQGVDNVDIKFWPFWVSAAPEDTKKISIEFNLDESK